MKKLIYETLTFPMNNQWKRSNEQDIEQHIKNGHLSVVGKPSTKELHQRMEVFLELANAVRSPTVDVPERLHNSGT